MDHLGYNCTLEFNIKEVRLSIRLPAYHSNLSRDLTNQRNINILKYLNTIKETEQQWFDFAIMETVSDSIEEK